MNKNTAARSKHLRGIINRLRKFQPLGVKFPWDWTDFPLGYPHLSLIRAATEPEPRFEKNKVGSLKKPRRQRQRGTRVIILGTFLCRSLQNNNVKRKSPVEESLNKVCIYVCIYD